MLPAFVALARAGTWRRRIVLRSLWTVAIRLVLIHWPALLLLPDRVVDQVLARQRTEPDNQRRRFHERGEIDLFRVAPASRAGWNFQRLARGDGALLLARADEGETRSAFKNGEARRAAPDIL